MFVCCANAIPSLLRLALLSGLAAAIVACSGPEPEPSDRARVERSEAAGIPTSVDEPAGLPTVEDSAPDPVPDPAPAPAPADALAPAGDDIPPLVYMCPCDPRIVEDEPGRCPECGEELRPVRITLAYSCLGNTAFIQDTPGQCRTDGTDLVPISASMFWVCPDAPRERQLSPGTCADGSDRIRRFEALPHGDHNPRHGGQFFMASDAWHHLEGTYPSAGLFRVFFYDDWTEPLEPKGFSGRVIVTDASRNELAAVPLEPSTISNAMEARIPDQSLPFIASLRVRFEPGEPENLFDFRFTSYSEEPVAPLVTTNRAEPPSPSTAAIPAASSSEQPEPPPPAAASPPLPPPDSPEPPPSAPDEGPGQTLVTITRQSGGSGPQEDPIPSSLEEILAEFTAASEQLATDIENNTPLGQLWVPAIRTKNLALALVNDYLAELPPDQRAAAEDAANRLLRAAFAIDDFGDRGDRDAIVSAHEVFAAAADDLGAAYATVR